MKRVFSGAFFRDWIVDKPNLDVARVSYCYQIGSTFVACALLEDSLINLMSICDKVTVKLKLGEDSTKWQTFLEKRQSLQSSTLGMLISILERHGVLHDDIKYLKWVKNKRDHFIHRLFQEGGWPADLEEEEVYLALRRLQALEHVFIRCSNRAPSILVRAELFQGECIGDGMLLFNSSLYEL